MQSFDVPPKLPRSRGAFLRRTHYSYPSQAGDSGTTRGGYGASGLKCLSRKTARFVADQSKGPCLGWRALSAVPPLGGNALCPRRFLNSSRSHLVPRAAAPPRTASALLATGARLPQPQTVAPITSEHVDQMGSGCCSSYLAGPP